MSETWPKNVEDFHRELDDVNLGPLWAAIQVFNSFEPLAKPIPYLWRGDLIAAKLDKATEILRVGMGAVERRAVYLVNPGMKDLQPFGWGGATQTLYAAVQAINPGEIAPSHRHTAAALRFIMHGHGGRGRVNGEKITFEPGDFLITPDWSWHDHTNEGSDTVVWMDCLDTPFIMALNVSFTELHPDGQQPLLVPDDYSSRRYRGGMVRPISDRVPSNAPLGRYPWELTASAIEGLSEFEPDPVDGYAVEYINPSTGRDADGRIGARMQKLPPHFHGRPHRHVHSTVYYAYEGKGYTIINGIRFDWNPGDFFTIPSWAWHEHVNLSERDGAYLFSTNDLPIMEAFHFEREQAWADPATYQPVQSTFEPIRPGRLVPDAP